MLLLTLATVLQLQIPVADGPDSDRCHSMGGEGAPAPTTLFLATKLTQEAAGVNICLVWRL